MITSLPDLLAVLFDWPHSTERAREPIARGHDQPPESTVVRQDIEWSGGANGKYPAKKIT